MHIAWSLVCQDEQDSTFYSHHSDHGRSFVRPLYRHAQYLVLPPFLLVGTATPMLLLQSIYRSSAAKADDADD